MSGGEIAVKKYVVTLSVEERERLQSLIRSGKHPARKLMRARILLKADTSEAATHGATARRLRGSASNSSKKELTAC